MTNPEPVFVMAKCKDSHSKEEFARNLIRAAQESFCDLIVGIIKGWEPEMVARGIPGLTFDQIYFVMKLAREKECEIVTTEEQ